MIQARHSTHPKITPKTDSWWPWQAEPSIFRGFGHWLYLLAKKKPKKSRAMARPLARMPRLLESVPQICRSPVMAQAWQGIDAQLKLGKNGNDFGRWYFWMLFWTSVDLFWWYLFWILLDWFFFWIVEEFVTGVVCLMLMFVKCISIHICLFDVWIWCWDLMFVDVWRLPFSSSLPRSERPEDALSLLIAQALRAQELWLATVLDLGGWDQQVAGLPNTLRLENKDGLFTKCCGNKRNTSSWCLVHGFGGFKTRDQTRDDIQTLQFQKC